MLIFSNFISMIFDRFVKIRWSDGAVESSRSRRREWPVLRRTCGTPQGQVDEAQLRYWKFSGAVIFVSFVILAIGCMALPLKNAHADNIAAESTHQDIPRISPIGLFQKFVSRADGDDRCPMYPSCSNYAAEAFQKKGLFKGWILTCDRLLRCGRDETRLSPPISIQGVRHTSDPLAANTFWWDKP